MIKPKVAYFTNIAPHYRERLWLTLVSELDVELHFFFGYYSDQSILSIDFEKEEWKRIEKQIHKIDNFKINKRLIFQRRTLREIIFEKWDCIILLGDANIISNWIISLIAKIKGIPVIFWGHGLYGNESFFKKLTRKSFLSLADYNLVYGHWSKNLLIKENFKADRIRIIYNSVNYEISKPLRESSVIPNFYRSYFNNDLPTLMFIGRLTMVKKLNLLIEAVHQLNSKTKKFNLIVVGDGEVIQDLKSLAKKLEVNAYFHGASYNEQEISKFIANADLCVSPGNVGLTSVHAMSYGTPVCTSNDFNNQGPEFEAIKAWETGCFFDKEKGNLVETISKWYETAPAREEVRRSCYKVIDTYYNPSVQIKVLKQVLKEIIG